MAKHEVRVQATPGKTGDVDFTPKSPLWRKTDRFPDGCFVFNKDEHMNMKHTDHHYVRFVLQDDTKLGLQFPSDPKNALWVIRPTDGQQCPTKDDKSDYSVFTPTDVEVDKNGIRNALLVTNVNMSPEIWSFTLNFVKRGGDESAPSTYVCWDPIGHNQDGGSA